jgi:hypothetical protein
MLSVNRVVVGAACLALVSCAEQFAARPPPAPAPATVDRTYAIVLADDPSTISARGADVVPLSRRWHGEWETDTGYRCSFELTLQANSSGGIEAVFAWKLLDAPRDSSMRSRIGESGREWARGYFDPMTHELVLEGYRVDAPKLLVTDRYAVVVDGNGTRFEGRSAGEGGLWIDRLRASAVR